ncbi:hypothetical protein, partial [Helicobacter sp. T3_23-1056]
FHLLAMTKAESMIIMTACGADCHALDFAKMQNLIVRNDDGRVVFAFATATTCACVLNRYFVAVGLCYDSNLF